MLLQRPLRNMAICWAVHVELAGGSRLTKSLFVLNCLMHSWMPDASCSEAKALHAEAGTNTSLLGVGTSRKIGEAVQAIGVQSLGGLPIATPVRTCRQLDEHRHKVRGQQLVLEDARENARQDDFDPLLTSCRQLTWRHVQMTHRPGNQRNACWIAGADITGSGMDVVLHAITFILDLAYMHDLNVQLRPVKTLNPGHDKVALSDLLLPAIETNP